MIRAARLVACLIIAATAAWAVYHLHRIYGCNVRSQQAERAIVRLLSVNDQITARIAARRIIDDMDHCIPCSPTDINQYMIRAAALRMVGRPTDAALDYRRALRIDRRAELYLNLGEVEMEAGRDETAKDAFITAVFLVYTYVDTLPQPMQQRVRDAVTPTYVLIQQGRAPRGVIDELRRRITRDPL